MENKVVTQLVQLFEYREQRQHIFPSPSSLEWFVRKHRSGLVRAGALLLLTGRWRANPEKFDDYIVQIGDKAAQARAEAGHAEATRAQAAD